MISGTVLLRFLMKATNWKMTPEWCCTLYTSPKLITTCCWVGSELKRWRKHTHSCFLKTVFNPPAVSLPVYAASPWPPPGPWAPAWLVDWQQSCVWWVMSAVVPAPADPPSVRCTCTTSATGDDRKGYHREHASYCRSGRFFQRALRLGCLRCWSTVRSCRTLPPPHVWSTFHSEAKEKCWKKVVIIGKNSVCPYREIQSTNMQIQPVPG